MSPFTRNHRCVRFSDDRKPGLPQISGLALRLAFLDLLRLPRRAGTQAAIRRAARPHPGGRPRHGGSGVSMPEVRSALCGERKRLRAVLRHGPQDEARINAEQPE